MDKSWATATTNPLRSNSDPVAEPVAEAEPMLGQCCYCCSIIGVLCFALLTNK